MALGGGSPELRGRRSELDILDQVVRDVRDGRSAVLVLRGEAGCGKTALLDALAGRASHAVVLRAAGVESESEIAYSALQQLCAPLMNHQDALPRPQREALTTALGLAGGPPPQQLLIGLAVLGLFAEAAARQPLICIVDDAQWIDAMSAVILGFVARRLTAEAVALVFATRSPGDEKVLAGLPELRVEGLADQDARALLDSVLTGPVEQAVRDRIIAETRGNPLALLELPRGLSPAELAFGFGGSGAVPLVSRVEQGFERRIAALPASARTVLLAAAAEPLGDATLLWRALERLGVNPEAAVAAEAARLIEFGTRVRFPHPLIRSAAWRCGRPDELRAVHAALAEVTDPATDPDRRAWHRAHAALGPNEQVAAELEDSADRAKARSGWSAAAAFLERAAELTAQPSYRGALLVSAASARAEAGSFDRVPGLLASAELWPLDPLLQAQAERLRARVAFMLRHGRDAVAPLLAAARHLEKLDSIAARDTYLLALGAAIYAGRYGDDDLRRTAQAARDAGLIGDSFPDLLLAALVAWVLDGRRVAAPLLNEVLDTAGSPEHVDLVWLVTPIASEMFRIDVPGVLSEQAVKVALDTGALSQLPNALAIWATTLINAGRLTEAAEMLDEIDAVNAAVGASVYQISRLNLTAWRGPERAALELIDAKLQEAAATGNGRLHMLAQDALTKLYLGLGDHRAALAAAQDLVAYPEMGFVQWGFRELVEAAVGAGEPAIAAAARAQLADGAEVTPTPGALGMLAVADALVESNEQRFRDAIGHLSRPETTIQRERARLLLGEWLSGQSRIAEARDVLRASYEAFASMGADVYADRAQRGLAALGETVRLRQPGVREELTSQEAAIAQLASTGRTNQEIAATLFLSPRTVEWHLGKIFTKLGIASRRNLADALRDRGEFKRN